MSNLPNSIEDELEAVTDFTDWGIYTPSNDTITNAKVRTVSVILREHILMVAYLREF